MRNRKPKSNQPRPASNERHPPFVVVSFSRDPPTPKNMKEPLKACKLKRSSLLRVPGGSARVTEKPSSYLDRELGGRIGVGVLRAACTPVAVSELSRPSPTHRTGRKPGLLEDGVGGLDADSESALLPDEHGTQHQPPFWGFCNPLSNYRSGQSNLPSQLPLGSN